MNASCAEWKPRVARRRALLVLLAGLGALALCAPQSARASGFVHPDNGPEALARGGANTAAVDDASALYYNPANLAKLDGLSIFLASNFTFLHTSFERAGVDQRLEDTDEDGELNPGFDERRNEPFETVERECPDDATLCTPAGFVAPMLFVGYGGDGWGVGVGAWGPPGIGAVAYPEDGPQRYQLIKQSLSLIWLGAGGAAEIGPVRLGATVMAGRLNILYRLMVDASVAPLASEGASREYRGENSPQYNQAFDVPFELQATGWSAAGIFGAAWDILPELTLALHVQTQTKFDADGSLSVEFTDVIPDNLATLSDDSASLEVNFPWFVRLGLMWAYELEAQQRLFDVELDLVYESWRLNEANVLEIPGSFGTGPGAEPIGNIRLVKNWQDTFGVRFGTSIYAFEWWTAMLGTFFETGAVPEETTSLDNYSYNRFGVTLGSTFHTPFGLDVAVGYGHIFQPSRTVDESQVRVTIPLSQCAAPYDAEAVCPEPGEPPGQTIGDGTYDADFDIWSVGLIYHY